MLASCIFVHVMYKCLQESLLLFLGDDDVDCIGNLICFQRSGFTAVPGCTGQGSDNSDYCIRPETNEPTEVPTRSPITNGPTNSPSNAPFTLKPTEIPSRSPVTQKPTSSPSESPATTKPTVSPSEEVRGG